MWLFSYGSNNKEQLELKLGRRVMTLRAKAPNQARCFVGYSKRWNGGVATLIPKQGITTYGLAIEATPRILQILDLHEGVQSGNYTRKLIDVDIEFVGRKKAVVYVSTSTEFNAPSKEYLEAIAKTIGEHWKASDGGDVKPEHIVVRNPFNWSIDKHSKGVFPYQQEIDYMGFIAIIRPTDFLSLAMELPDKYQREESIKHLIDCYDKNKNTAPPALYIQLNSATYLNSSTHFVVGHDGRHRCEVAIKNKEEFVPVCIFLRDESGSIKKGRSLSFSDIENIYGKLIRNEDKNGYELFIPIHVYFRGDVYCRLKDGFEIVKSMSVDDFLNFRKRNKYIVKNPPETCKIVSVNDEDPDAIDKKILKQADKLRNKVQLGISSTMNLSMAAVDQKTFKLYGLIYTSFQDGDYSFDVLVDPDARGKGIAGKLIDAAVSDFHELRDIYGFENPKMNVNVVNQLLVSTLEKRGFVVVNEFHTHSGNDSQWIMEYS
jgi:GNAT superfamily N-acetyltransferase/cation transport regulator ChaC